MVNLDLVRNMAKTEGYSGLTSRAPTPTAPVVQGKRWCLGKMARYGEVPPRKKVKTLDHHKYLRDGEGSRSRPLKGKEPIRPAGETPAPSPQCPKLVKELCKL
ncbi:hypothetical protein GW17_00027539 [Ensete ventricosum]|nr:hypothetical protein GW17_00027539 [Ensete ventricosum]RZR76577.1 hypothetical protein BHM03_00001403 [Ensete ventricosum]